MRKIVYAGSTFYTGDALAEALMDYARALARHDIADTIFVPGRTMQGDTDKVELLIGPASQIVSEPVELMGVEIEDDELVAQLRSLTAQLAPRKPTAEPADGSGDGRDGRPFDDML
ncbi:hypothetical protein [Leifsonia sp. 1010]|uniref:hypothetical protein n=1 Tax=Leifsonia sp. 1010 TaxID=2817769 RepID=UPI00285F47D7|nr:hypothetical protein [Leifsonia sp. 1010]MDR6612837.1 hypothetical protein [Leifsonia sp. 1010]